MVSPRWLAASWAAVAAMARDLSVGLVGHSGALRRLAVARATWLRGEDARFFANVSDERFGELLVRLPDDAQLADDPLHNNPGEARFVPALLFLTRYMRASWYLLGDDDSFFFLGRLRRELSRFDASERWFFGLPSRQPFGRCDASGACEVPLAVGPRRVAWPQPPPGEPLRWCAARPQRRCPVAEVTGVGAWCDVVRDPTMPYGYRVVGGFLPAAREALLAVGVGSARSQAQRRAATLAEPVAAPEARGRAEFPLAVWPVGGFGLIVSAGAADSLRPWQWQECVRKLRCGPGDMRLAACLARFAGVGLAQLEGLGDRFSRHPVKDASHVLALHREDQAESVGRL